ncbi:PH domain-containing protein [Luteimonas aquatica]|uniref:PH domain-containing protein n=1 Tax=Luteimonas aquatica TaxID=450364 RepID=UPI001F59EF81|nr:PH domain-containing protein [Luteimonas aquatica]
MNTSKAVQDFPVAAPSRLSWGILLALWVALLVIAYAQPHQQPPHNPVPWWLVVPFGLALVVIGPYILLLHRRIRLKGRMLVAEAALHTRRVPVEELSLDQARIVSLDEHIEFKPMLRLFGFGLPGFKAGHYLLRNRRRAFCVLTDRRRVLVLPHGKGKLLLLSPEKPQALLDELRRMAQTPPQD